MPEHDGTLTEHDAGDDPFALFATWYAEATQDGDDDSSAMALATATPAGVPSVRMVLLRGFDRRGFAFFTNYRSRKASELDANPHAALVMYWPKLKRQVRVEGTVSVVSPEESDAYFRGRPRGSQLGAWSSPQSQVVPDRAFLEALMTEWTTHHAEGDVPRPDYWGGYRIEPLAIEFWQARDSRLHDRIRFRREADGTWTRERLAP